MKRRTSVLGALSVTLFGLLACSEAATDGTEAAEAQSSELSSGDAAPSAQPPRSHDPARFVEKLDANKDGKLQISELPERKRERMGAADTNKDGVLTSDEMKAHFAAKHAERFAKIDKNGDGAVTADEAGARWTHLALADADKDGRLTSAEFAAVPKHGRGFGRHGGHRGPRDPNAMFGKFDANGDGLLQPDEVPGKLAERFKSIDGNADGKLSKDELTAHMKAMHEARGANRPAPAPSE